MTLDELRVSGRATITVEEAAEVLGPIGRGTAYEAVRRGEIPSLRLGRRILVPVPRLLAMLGVNDVESPSRSDEHGAG